MGKIKNNGSARIFENKYLEMLTKSHPVVIDVMYLLITGYVMYFAFDRFNIEPVAMLAVFFAGIFSWTFFEYLLHRYIFHYTGPFKILFKLHYYLHEVHHEYPKDKGRLVMPPVPSLIFSALFLGLFYLVLGKWGIPLWSGFMVGYLIYSTIHYLIHLDKTPKFLEDNKRHHTLHHYQQQERAFGVSTRFWDWVFNTMPIVKKSKTTARAAGS